MLSVGSLRFGTRLFNAGHAHDPVHLMRVGKDGGLAIGLGTPPLPDDLVVYRSSKGPEPFDVQNDGVKTIDVPGLPPVWVAKVQSLLRLKH